MTGAFLFIGMGAALFLLMLAWRYMHVASELEAPPTPSDPYVMRRIIWLADMVYVSSLKVPRIRRRFLRERRRLALDWLRASRTEAICLLRNHTEAVRHSSDIRPAGELRIVAAFVAFVVLNSVVAGMIRLFGPFRTPAVLRSVEYMTGSLECLNRALKGVIPSEIRAYSA